jgi:hypothetical protein
VKITLPFDLRPVFDGTGIADCYNLKAKDGKTIVELASREDEQDFLAVLKELERELRYRLTHSNAHVSRSPLSPKRRNALQEHIDMLIQARMLIERAR